MVVLRVPAELVSKAVSDPNSEEAQEYKDIQKDAADLHAGKTTNIVLLSDRDTSGNLLYDVELKGIEGGGKQYMTSDIIDQKRKSIYNTFGTGFLLLGQSNVGSNAAASTGNTTHDYYVQRTVLNKVDVLNNQLAPRILAANNIYLDYKDMPTFVPADPTEASADDIGKFIQRVGSVNKLTSAVMEHFMEQMGAPLEGIDELDYTDKGQSRAGESEGSSGTGSSQSGGVASATNSNNGGMDKALVMDGDYIIDPNTGDPIEEQHD